MAFLVGFREAAGRRPFCLVSFFVVGLSQQPFAGYRQAVGWTARNGEQYPSLWSELEMHREKFLELVKLLEYKLLLSAFLWLFVSE